MTYKQTFIVNSDLGMGKGKAAVQVAHGEVYYMEHIIKSRDVIAGSLSPSDNENENDFKKYHQWRYDEDGLMKKAVLKATEEEIKELMLKLEKNNIWHYKVIDAGLTQIPQGSLTCVVVEPLSDIKHDELFGHLKLL